MRPGRFEIWAMVEARFGLDGGAMFAGDLFPTTSLLRLPWTMGYDLSPLEILEETRRLLEESHHQGTWLRLEPLP